jgi:hypothetical protein
LTTATETKTVAGDLEKLPPDARGIIIKFMAYLEREGYSAQTGYPETLRHLAKDGANLLDPENVKQVIVQQRKKNGEPWKDSVKMLATYAYDAFCRMQGIKWNMPIYHQEETTLYIPEEKDLDLLISAASRRMATYLQCLKETFADPREILRTEWIDLKNNVLSINHLPQPPSQRASPRQIRDHTKTHRHAKRSATKRQTHLPNDIRLRHRRIKETQKKSSSKIPKPKPTVHNLQILPPLGRLNAGALHQRQLANHKKNAQTQKHPKHNEVHPHNRVQTRRLRRNSRHNT